MSLGNSTFRGGPIFDGITLHEGKAARFENGVLQGIVPAAEVDATQAIPLNGDILSPGFIDLQVNGGGGMMLNDAPSLETIRTIATAHRPRGTTALLPTLISDSRARTYAAIEATIAAVEARVPGVVGLHLEGPHLSIARKGAHDASHIRPMETDDLRRLIDAKRALPVLKVTVAPENVTPDQVAALAEAGILVSLGHTDADYDTCLTYAQAGARCVTHLFNAMSQMGNRAPGVVGAALTAPQLSAGLIADGVHVHPATMAAAWRAKAGPGQMFLVTDAMAVAGTDQSEFTLNNRRILRRDGQLRLEDGTLAGADLDLIMAISVLVQQVGVPLTAALAAATSIPAHVAGLDDGHLSAGKTPLNSVIRISPDLRQAIPIISDGELT